MKVKIFRPTKTAMQSGKKNTKKWLVKPLSEETLRSINPLTGWISSNNTISQLSFEFNTKEEAVEFAKSKNFEFEIEEPKLSTIKQKSYTANFTS
jgi:hypothetical protein